MPLLERCGSVCTTELMMKLCASHVHSIQMLGHTIVPPPSHFSLRYSKVIPEIADQYWPENLVLVTHQHGVEQAIALALGLHTTGDFEVGDFEVMYCGNVEMSRNGKEKPWKLVSTNKIFEYDKLF